MPTLNLYVRESAPAFLADTVPQERIGRLGPEALRTAELLSLLLDFDHAAANKLLEAHPLPDLATLPYDRLAQQLTPSRAARFQAALELTQRAFSKGLGTAPTITGPTDAVPLLAEFGSQQREHFVCLYLNARNQLLHREIVSIGSLSASIVHPREVFLPAVLRSAASVLLAHNHPSSDVSPSRDDLALTKRLVQAGALLGIEVLDHLIISTQDVLSFREKGLL